MRLIFRQHAIRRMFELGIGVEDVRTVLETGREIEGYPDDTPYPSALILGFVGARPLHVVCADNPADGERIVITVYEPDPARWSADFTTRETR